MDKALQEPAPPGLSTAEWAIVLVLIGGMLALELLNTAIEHVVD
jgi:undecaprenol kinase